jgi:hypothetical protein
MITRITTIACVWAALCAAQNTIELPFGLLRPTPERYQTYPVTGIPPAGVLPKQVSSLEPYLPPPGNQGTTQGSCTAWATAFAARTAVQAKLNAAWRPLDIASRQFSPSFVFNTVKAAAGGSIVCTSGIYFDSALDILLRNGVPTIDQFPYDPDHCAMTATSAQLNQAKNYKIATWFKLPDLSTATIKTQLANEDPVLVGIDVYDSFEQTSGTSTIKGRTGPVRGYHAIVLIGYDDDKQAFRLQNSWGATWGDQGRAWIDYNTLGEIVHEGYRVVPVLPAASFFLTERFGIINDTTTGEDSTRLLSEMLTKRAAPSDTPENTGKYAVLVNAFAAKDQALLTARSIAQGASGLAARIETKTINGKPEFLVVVGAQLSSLEAGVVLQRALRLGYAGASTIPMN